MLGELLCWEVLYDYVSGTFTSHTAVTTIRSLSYCTRQGAAAELPRTVRLPVLSIVIPSCIFSKQAFVVRQRCGCVVAMGNAAAGTARREAGSLQVGNWGRSWRTCLYTIKVRLSVCQSVTLLALTSSAADAMDADVIPWDHQMESSRSHLRLLLIHTLLTCRIKSHTTNEEVTAVTSSIKSLTTVLYTHNQIARQELTDNNY